MITLFTGAPGAGKTAALVDLLMREYSGRAVYSDGLDGLQLPHEPLDALNWFEVVPDGSLVVIDEVQRLWRPRGAGTPVPRSVSELETHRHRGLDFLITTQSPSLLDKNVRELVGRHIHIRDVGVLGRHWYEWPECSVSMSWKTCVNKKRWKLPKTAFAAYKSASLHVPPVRGFPRALIVVIVCLVLAVIGWSLMYQRVLHKAFDGGLTATANQSATSSGDGPAVVPPGHSNVSQSGAPDVLMDFVPRLPGRPETAPAYDHLRKIDVLPVVSGGMCWGKTATETCRCFVPGGFDAPISADECRTLVLNPLPYNPYQPKMQAVAMASPASPTDRQTGGPETPNRGGP